MPITLSPETEKLIEDWMNQTGIDSADEIVRFALQTLEQVQGANCEDLDPELRREFDEAEAEYQRGGGIPADEAFRRLREKYGL